MTQNLICAKIRKLIVLFCYFCEKIRNMKDLLRYILKTSVLLLLLFDVMRLFFVLNYIPTIKSEHVAFADLLSVVWHDKHLDLSTVSYLMAIPVIVACVLAIMGRFDRMRWLRVYFVPVIFFYNLIVMGETGVYGEWKTKLSYKVLLYLKEPSEIISSVSTGKVAYFIVMLLLFSSLFVWLYIRFCEPKTKAQQGVSWSSLIAMPFLFGLTFLGIRGGLNAIPISTASAYFSEHYFVNIVSVNPAYNLMESVTNGVKFDSQVTFDYMPVDKAAERVAKLHDVDCDSTVVILGEKRPNVVIVLLESWSADLIESLGGHGGITPNFASMEKEGLLFTNCYSSGNRSQQGIASIYSGLPAVPVTTITLHPEKYHACQSLPADLEKQGYYTSFYFGGRLNYGNILSFLKYLNFNRIVEGDDIKEPGFERGKLGIHDSYMLPWYAKQLSTMPQPFFSTVFTISSHSPYDCPRIDDTDFSWCSMERDFIESAHYTDHSLSLFMEEARLQPWYDNTIFVFIADHSHNTYYNHPLYSFEYHKIPLLVYGKPLLEEYRGKQNDVIMGNTDFPAFLLAQLGLKHERYSWSKDFMNLCYRPFAYFEMGEGTAWKCSSGEFVLSNRFGYNVKKLPEKTADSIIMDGKAYVQHWYNEFCSY